MSSTSDIAISTTTSPLRIHARRPPVEPRAPSLRLSCRLLRVACIAGTMPEHEAGQERDRDRVGERTAVERPVNEVGNRVRRNRRDRGAPAWPRRATMPSGALSRPMITDSVSSCRMMRSRPAPSAARIEISRWRTDARASSRLATFEQAITRTSVTAPIIARITSSTCSGIIQSRSGPDHRAPALVLVRIGRSRAGRRRRSRSVAACSTRHAGLHAARTPAGRAHPAAVDSK